MLSQTYWDVGTVSVTAGNPNISFAGTSLGTIDEPIIMPGDLLVLDDQPLVPGQRIASIDYDAKTGVLWKNWPGATAAAADYEVRYVGIIERSTAQSRTIIERLGALPFVPADAAGSASFDLAEQTTAGAHRLRMKVAALAANRDFEFPDVDYANVADLFARWTKRSTVESSLLELQEASANGNSKVTVKTPAALGGDRIFILPDNNLTWSALLTALNNLSVGAGQFPRFTGAGAVAAQAIVGTVSQAGGTPTGAIAERGSNANGDYVRLADGTQICTSPSIVMTVAGTTALGGSSWTFPAAFAAAPSTLPAPSTVSGTVIRNMGVWSPSSISATAVGPRFLGPGEWSVGTDTLTLNIIAIGKWF